MQPFGVAMLLASAVAAIGWLLGTRPGGWQGLVPGIGESQQPGTVPKGDGSAAQPVGPATIDIPLPGQYSPTGGASGAFKAAQESKSIFEVAPSPVVPPKSATYVPNWTNPDSANTQVD